MTKLSIENRVFFIEEPVFDAVSGAYNRICKEPSADIHIVVPHLAAGLSNDEVIAQQRTLLRSLLELQSIGNYILWYYSPMSLSFTDELDPVYTIYDCMDELSAFLFAPPELTANEACLFKTADIVFTGGQTLFAAKKHLHANIHPFPSSIDKGHFLSARTASDEPADQKDIQWPRIGFYGVIDERLDIDMLSALAALRPNWQFILVGPVVKIDPATLPANKNIHYLGPKRYQDLPQYLGGWNIAMMPFALNDSTKFISPTKTPEYLAGGKPVISSSITDVVSPYGDNGLVYIADTPDDFIAAAEEILHNGVASEWLERVDAFLADLSWDKTAAKMKELIDLGIKKKCAVSSKKNEIYV